MIKTILTSCRENNMVNHFIVSRLAYQRLIIKMLTLKEPHVDVRVCRAKWKAKNIESVKYFISLTFSSASKWRDSTSDEGNKYRLGSSCALVKFAMSSFFFYESEKRKHKRVNKLNYFIESAKQKMKSSEMKVFSFIYCLWHRYAVSLWYLCSHNQLDTEPDYCSNFSCSKHSLIE